MRAKEIAAKAADLVGGEREQQHGSKVQNMSNIAYVWNGILKAAGKAGPRELDAHDVANLMEGLKVARRYSGSYNPDDYVDGCGYAACAGEIMHYQTQSDTPTVTHPFPSQQSASQNYQNQAQNDPLAKSSYEWSQPDGVMYPKGCEETLD